MRHLARDVGKHFAPDLRMLAQYRVECFPIDHVARHVFVGAHRRISHPTFEKGHLADNGASRQRSEPLVRLSVRAPKP